MAEHTIEISAYKSSSEKNYRFHEPHLPPVTESDNGKIAKVVGGKWVLGTDSGTDIPEIPENAFFVSLTYNEELSTTVSNYTAKEIYERVTAGQSCIAAVTMDGVYYQGLNLSEMNHSGNQYIVIFYSVGYTPSTGSDSSFVPRYFTYFKYVMSVDSSVAEPVNYITSETVRMSAEHFKFDNGTTGLSATDIQNAIKEINAKIPTIPESTSSDAGKVLVVGPDGVPIWQAQTT